MDDAWKQLKYKAERRSMVELESILKGFVHFCEINYPQLHEDLKILVECQDPILIQTLSKGTLPSSTSVLLAEAFAEFLERQGISNTPRSTKPLQEGEWVLFLDTRGRTYLQRLASGKNFTFHHGSVSFDDIIGREEGHSIRSTMGAQLLVFRPTLKDYLLKMPRHAQVVYPKDSAMLVLWADLYPGARVLESGLGSGALAMVILRYIGAEGCLLSYEVRKSFIDKARRNIERFFGYSPKNHIIYPEDITRARIEPGYFDRVFLDLPTPQDGLPVASAALRPGGILVSLSPTVPQIQQTVDWLRASDLFAHIEVLENLQRPWHVRGSSVRPAHNMVAHTAFLVIARRIQAGQQYTDEHCF